jgi:cell division initiation protein
MRVSPVDISNKSFSKKLMGVDPQEVYEFIRDVADQMEELMRDRNRLKEEVQKKEIEMREYKERDEALRATIQAASRMSEQFRTDAEREATLIIQDARQRSEVLIKDARDSLKRMYHEIADLKKSRMQYETSLRSLMEAHLTMLDQGRKVFLDPIIAPPKPEVLVPTTTADEDQFAVTSPGVFGNA